jgi:hypothetical protein
MRHLWLRIGDLGMIRLQMDGVPVTLQRYPSPWTLDFRRGPAGLRTGP